MSAPRDLGASLIGAVSNAYPLRKKWDQLVKKGVPGGVKPGLKTKSGKGKKGGKGK